MSLDWLSPEETRWVLALYRDLFGIDPARFQGYRLGRRGDGIYAVDAVAAEQAAYLNWVAGGVRIVSESRSGHRRPTTQGVQVFGGWATRALCDVDDQVLGALLRGASVPWPGERGLRILRWRGHPVGLGTVRNDQLVGQLPRSITEHLQRGEEGALC